MTGSVLFLRLGVGNARQDREWELDVVVGKESRKYIMNIYVCDHCSIAGVVFSNLAPPKLARKQSRIRDGKHRIYDLGIFLNSLDVT